MRELVVDLTPTCVNRTAIHTIAFDTLRALRPHFATAVQYRGGRMEQVADPAREAAIRGAFSADLLQWIARSVHADEIGPRPSDQDDRTPRLYFDPIYTLYRPLYAGDVVFVLDLSTLTDPEWHSPTVAIAYERAFRKLMSSPARIVCISTHCATALRTSFSIPQADITLVPLYLRALPSAAAVAPAAALSPRKFILFVGSLETRKNVVGLMRAFAMSGLADRGWTLALAGGKGQGAEAIIEAAGELAGVELLGFVSDAELTWLYANAAAFAYPSYLEGFGLPLLEAMAHGLPCMASITGASKEVCGDSAILVDPYHLPAIVDGLIACADRSAAMRDTQRRDMIERTRAFTFDRYFGALMAAFETAHA